MSKFLTRAKPVLLTDHKSLQKKRFRRKIVADETPARQKKAFEYEK